MIAAGATHTVAVTSDGRVMAWGSNHRGQLGRAEYAYAASPVIVAFMAPGNTLDALLLDAQPMIASIHFG